MAPDPQLSSTHSDDTSRRKPRRLGLYLPWAALVIAAAGWSLAWLWMMHGTQSRLDAAAISLRKAGWTVAWDSRHVGGYPFRLDVDVTNLRVAEPSGWAATMPGLKSEAFAFAPTDWVLYAPNGLTFTRPHDGPVIVTAGALRASLNSWDETPPRISLEGDDLTFAAAPAAKPFSLTAAKNVQFYTRAGPGQQAAVFFSLDGGAARPASWVGQLAGGKPVAIRLDAIMSHTDELAGGSWPSLVAHWSAKGGDLDVASAHALTASGDTPSLDVRKGGARRSLTTQRPARGGAGSEPARRGARARGRPDRQGAGHRRRAGRRCARPAPHAPRRRGLAGSDTRGRCSASLLGAAAGARLRGAQPRRRRVSSGAP